MLARSTPRPLAALPPPASGPAAGGRSRIAALDVARALGVVAMVVGHTLDAVLAVSVRAQPAVVAYWKARGLTAPVFMMASGWAIAVAIGRSGLGGLAVARGRLPRVLLLLALGYALRWPGWGTEQLAAGDLSVWAHLLAFDALHAIAISILASALVFGLPWTARKKACAFALLAMLAVVLGMRGPAPLPSDPPSLQSLAGVALAQAYGGTSPFPLFPWAAFFFSGAILGLLAGEGSRRSAAAMAIVGGALVLATCRAGVGTLPAWNPILVAFRIGAVLIAFAALYAIPGAIAARLAPLGRSSLAVYAIHLAVVYGWSTHDGLLQRVGPNLPLAHALGVALAVLAGSLAVRGLARRGARWAWERRGAAGAAVGAAMRGLRGAG